MTKKHPYVVLAFYKFVDIENPVEEVARHKDFFEGRDVKGRIYMGEEGINAQMSASVEAADAYMAWLEEGPLFSGIHFKIDPYPEHCFAKLTVKAREQLAAMDVSVDTREGGEHVEPARWKEMLDGNEAAAVLDIRNDYEWDIGHFEGAERPEMRTFREFPEYAKRLKERLNPEKDKVMMYCTGGIRCELYSALLKREGFEHVYQLNGGVINYGHKVGNEHWKGKLFVFDDRMAVPISEETHSVIGKCAFCEVPADHPYNCANMDCNRLFLACPKCVEEKLGCCSSSCTEQPRLRPLEHQMTGKPFRKWYHYSEEKNG